MTKTKIIATIGPACQQDQQIKSLIQAGVNIFRFNLKHNTQEWHNQHIIKVKKISQQLKKTVGILLDLQGPEIRTEAFQEGSLKINQGDHITFSTTRKPSQRTIVVDNLKLLQALKPGTLILIDDGSFQFRVQSQKSGQVETVALSSGILGSSKGVNLKNISVDISTLVKTDFSHLSLAAKHNVDFIALSFVRTANDINQLRQEMHQRQITAQIIAKIETQSSLDNFPDILTATDGIMVARGDLGIEIDYYKLPIIQKQLIQQTHFASKPVITATQMLHSMTQQPFPTRAEISDIANAVLDQTDAIMLSAETATGLHPLSSVQTMSQTAYYTEKNQQLADQPKPFHPIVAKATQLYRQHNQNQHQSITAFLIFTHTGYTARLISSFHPDIPIIAITNQTETADQLTLVYGIQPYYHSQINLDQIYSQLIKDQILNPNDQIIQIIGHQLNLPQSEPSVKKI